MSTPSLLILLTGLLAMATDKPGRDGLVWLLVGSVLSPLLAALAMWVTKALDGDGARLAGDVSSANP